MEALLRIVAAQMTKTLKELPAEEHISAFLAMRSAFSEGLYNKLILQPDGTVNFTANAEKQPVVQYIAEGGVMKRKRRTTKKQRRN